MESLNLSISKKQYEELKDAYRCLPQFSQEKIMESPIWNLMDVLHLEIDIFPIQITNQQGFYDRTNCKLLRMVNRNVRNGDIVYITKPGPAVDNTYINRAYSVEVHSDGFAYLAAADTMGGCKKYFLKLIPDQYFVLAYV